MEKKEINARFGRVRVYEYFSPPPHTHTHTLPPFTSYFHTLLWSPHYYYMRLLEGGPERYNNIDPDESGVGVSRRLCRRHLGYIVIRFNLRQK